MEVGRLLTVLSAMILFEEWGTSDKSLPMLEFSEGKIQYFLVRLITLPNLRNLAEQ